MDLITGIMVATNGMLSTTADAIADIHRMANAVTARSPSVESITRSARILNTPASSIPLTAMNRPMKKKMVDPLDISESLFDFFRLLRGIVFQVGQEQQQSSAEHGDGGGFKLQRVRQHKTCDYQRQYKQ